MNAVIGISYFSRDSRERYEALRQVQGFGSVSIDKIMRKWYCVKV